MKFQRLVLEDGTASKFVDLHPRLTVIAGLDAADRRVLLTEIRGSLGAHRDGVHLEMVTDSGVALAAFRSADGHRMIDIDNTTDVTNNFLDPAGRLNPAFGLGLRDEGLVIDAASLAARNDDDRTFDLLTGADQEELWGILDRIDETGRAMSEAEAEHLAMAADNTNDELNAEVYDNYFASSEDLPAINKIATIAGGAGLIGAAVLFFGSISAIGAAVLAVVCLAVVGFYGYPLLRQALAERAANKALANAGIDNFFNFQLQQVDGMLAQDNYRKKLREATAGHETALADWQALAGELDPQFAIDRRSAITTAAALRAADPDDDPTTGFLHPTTPLMLRCIGEVDAEAERVPRVLDAPFSTLDETTRRTLLDALFAASEHRQVVLLAASDDVTGWVLQHIDGDASVLPGFMSVEEPVHVS